MSYSPLISVIIWGLPAFEPESSWLRSLSNLHWASWELESTSGQCQSLPFHSSPIYHNSPHVDANTFMSMQSFMQTSVPGTIFVSCIFALQQLHYLLVICTITFYVLKWICGNNFLRQWRYYATIYLLKNARWTRAQMGWMQILLTVTAQWSLKEIHFFYLAKFSLRLSELHLTLCPFDLLLKGKSTLSSDQTAQSFSSWVLKTSETLQTLWETCSNIFSFYLAGTPFLDFWLMFFILFSCPSVEPASDFWLVTFSWALECGGRIG